MRCWNVAKMLELESLKLFCLLNTSIYHVGKHQKTSTSLVWQQGPKFLGQKQTTFDVRILNFHTPANFICLPPMLATEGLNVRGEHVNCVSSKWNMHFYSTGHVHKWPVCYDCIQETRRSHLRNITNHTTEPLVSLDVRSPSAWSTQPCMSPNFQIRLSRSSQGL